MRSILEHVRAFVCECPCLREAGIKTVGAGFLGNGSMCASVEPVADAVLTRYADGAQRRYYDFNIAIRAPYGIDTRANLDMARLCEAVAAWVRVCGRDGVFPQTDIGRVDGISPKDSVSPAPDAQNTTGTARYEIPCRLTYYIVSS